MPAMIYQFPFHFQFAFSSQRTNPKTFTIHKLNQSTQHFHHQVNSKSNPISIQFPHQSINYRKMGKGGGCVPSKNRAPITVSDPDHDLPPPPKDHKSAAQSHNPAGEISRNRRIFIVYYSMYGHVELLAKRMKKGVDSVDGVEGVLFKVPETLPPQTLQQMRVPPKDDGVPVISVEEMVQADGFLFGFPTRYGSMAAQMKSFFDSTIDLWENQRLAGIPAGLFVSTGTQGGGQETTALTAVTLLAHHGMVYVPIGYTFGSEMTNIASIRGGSPYGAGVFSGDGSRPPSPTELDLAHHQGKYMATLLKRSLPLPS